jgi:general secretion pathway protein D
MVGNNVPIVTGSYTNTGASTTSVSPFQTYDRQDVGITLRVRPQIGEDGSIKLVIYQEVSSIVASTLTNASGPTTSKRAIESSVIVNDGQLIALGGLLSDEVDSTEDKVPVLGDVPVLGNLFKSQSRSRTKTDLMVFLRPVIVRDAAAAESYSMDRYEYMRALQQGGQPASNSMLQIGGGAPVMPPITPVNPKNANRPAASSSVMIPWTGNDGAPAAKPAPAMPAAGDQSDFSGPPIQLGAP